MTITSSTTSPLIAVIGATGAQGGSVTKALEASDKSYRIRGFTRNATSDSAKALAQRGIEVQQVSFSVSDSAHDEAVKAFQGADVLFAVTNFWEHTDTAREIAEGKLIVDAAKAANVRLLVWSGLPDIHALSNGKYAADALPHFRTKAEITRYARSTGIPLVDVQAGFYSSNFLHTPRPVKESDDTWAIEWAADGKQLLPFIDTESDYGLWVQAVIEMKPEDRPETVRTAGEELSAVDFIALLKEASGKNIRYKEITPQQARDKFAKSGIPQNIAEVFVYAAQISNDPQVGFYGGQPATLHGRDIQLARAPRTMKEYLAGADFNKMFA